LIVNKNQIGNTKTQICFECRVSHHKKPWGCTGGCKQSLFDEAPEDQPNSNAGEWMGKMVKRGRVKGPDFVEGAKAIQTSGADADPDLERVSKWKTYHNAHRGIMRLYGKKSKLPDVYYADAPLWDFHTNTKTTGKIGFILPNEVLASLEEHGREPSYYCNFSEDQLGFKTALENWCERTHITSSENIACLGFWGDMAPYHTRDSIFLCLFSILSGECHQRWWSCCFPKRVVCQCGCQGRCTFNVVWAVLAWSLRYAAAKLIPHRRHDGTLFAESTFKNDSKRAQRAGKKMKMGAACIQKKGDWQWMKQGLGLTGWRGEGPQKRICWLCTANCGDCPWTDASLGAKWRTGVGSHATCLASVYFSNQYLAGIFAFPGFSADYIVPDWMHCADLGVVQYLLGNILWEVFVSLGGVHSNPHDGCGKLLCMLHVFSDGPCPINFLTMGMIRVNLSAAPKLKLKAAEGRYMVPVVERLLRCGVACVTEHEHRRLHCLQALCRCYDEINAWVPDTSRDRLGSAARQFVTLYSELTVQAFAYDPSGLSYRLYPKFHLLVHCAEFSEVCPRLTWNYPDESAIGECADLAETLHAMNLQTSLIEK